MSFGVAGGIAGAPGHAEVALHDIAGRLVHTLARGAFEAGYRTAVWDGRDDHGSRVPGGIYFLRATTGGQSAQLKVVVMR